MCTAVPENFTDACQISVTNMRQEKENKKKSKTLIVGRNHNHNEMFKAQQEWLLDLGIFVDVLSYMRSVNRTCVFFSIRIWVTL